MALTGELKDRWPEWDLCARRRAAAAERLALYRGDYAKRVRKMVGDRIADRDSAREVARFVNAAHNLLGAVANACAVVYQRGARRELRGVDEGVARAFADLVVESRMPERASSLNLLAWVSGPTVAIPYVEAVRGVPRLCIEFVGGDRYEAKNNPADPDVLDAVLYQRDDGVLVEVDATGWHFYTSKGDRLDSGEHDAPHGLDYCPAVPIRARPLHPFDWHGATDHLGLCEASLEVAFLSALGRWVRMQTAVPLTEITALDDRYAKLQSLGHPTRPLVFNTEPAGVRVAVHDRTANPRDYLIEIQALASAAVVPYGLPPWAVSFASDGSPSIAGASPAAATALPGVLAQQRDAQAPLLHAGERALWLAACDVVRASDHRHAGALPERAEVEAALRVALPDLADEDVQLKRLQVLALAQPHGLQGPVDLLMSSRPELTATEAEEELRERLDAYTARIAALVERNVAADASRGVQTIAQMQGREGGRASGEARREENTDTP